MDCANMPTVSEAHPETMDLLSRTWCDFAVNKAFQPGKFLSQALVHHECSINSYDNGSLSPNFTKMESIKMDDKTKSLPPWKTNDVKSWIWMQQAMHPDLDYRSCFRKKRAVRYPYKRRATSAKNHLKKSWDIFPFKSSHDSIKNWLKEIKLKKKENERLQKAEVHAAISVANVAAALAAIAAKNSNYCGSNSATKEAAVASAAALVAAHCAKTAEAMGANKQQIKTAMSSAMCATSTSDILTLTVAASTSLRGASALKTRSGCKNMLNSNVTVMPIEENTDLEFDCERCRLMLRRGAELKVRTSDGRCKMRSVSIVLNHESKVILRTRKPNILNAFASKKECVVLDQHVELYKNPIDDKETCFLVVLTTTHGIIKLDIMKDDQRYKLWTRTINHMLYLSTSFTKYSLPYHKN